MIWCISTVITISVTISLRDKFLCPFVWKVSVPLLTCSPTNCCRLSTRVQFTFSKIVAITCNKKTNLYLNLATGMIFMQIIIIYIFPSKSLYSLIINEKKIALRCLYKIKIWVHNHRLVKTIFFRGKIILLKNSYNFLHLLFLLNIQKRNTKSIICMLIFRILKMSIENMH